MYVKPTLERLGTFREMTLGGGENICADGANPYARYPMA